MARESVERSFAVIGHDYLFLAAPNKQFEDVF